MRPRRRAALPLAGLLLFATLLLAGCGSSGPAPPPPGAGTRLHHPVAQRILDTPLRDSTGARRTLGDFRGKIVLVSDAMTLCQETCPLETATMVRTARAVERAGYGDDVAFVTLTVDPQRDTPRRLAAYRRLFSPAPGDWTTLTGTAENVNRVLDYLGIYHKRVPSDSPAPKDWMTGKPLTYDVRHSDALYFLDGDARERYLLTGAPGVPGKDVVPGRIYDFMSAEGHRNVLHPATGAWTGPQAKRALAWLLGHKLA